MLRRRLSGVSVQYPQGRFRQKNHCDSVGCCAATKVDTALALNIGPIALLLIGYRTTLFFGKEVFMRFPSTIAALFLALFVAACATNADRNPVPFAELDDAEVVGVNTVRVWGDGTTEHLGQMLDEREAQIRKHRPHKLNRRARFSFLAISGGGDDGAFGAGLLSGWSEHGGRPEFEMVTGVSTGALSAPFAFLGSRYDGALKEIYTQYSTKELISVRPLEGVFGGEAFTDNSKLADIIAKYVDQDLLNKIAAEHAVGRRLYIGTTNLDAQRPVVWDMGAIAASGHPQSLKLFRQVLLASAAIPGVFPPVHINVTVNGKTYDELHVDGGATAHVFFAPISLVEAKEKARIKRQARGTLYVIRNVKVAPEWKAVKASAFEIASRSLSTMMKNQANGDLFKMYFVARELGLKYRLASVPESFTLKSKEPFDPEYMSALFGVAEKMGREGYDWSKRPPGF